MLPRHILKRKRLTSGWTTSLKNVGCLNSLLTSNVRTVNGTQIVIITGVRLLLFLIGMKDTGAWFLNENEGECSDVHPLGLTTRCKKSTKWHIDLREFPPAVVSWGQEVRKLSFPNTLFSKMFLYLVFLIATFWKILKGFSFLTTITTAWHREAEPAIQGTWIWRGCRLRNIRLIFS